MSDKKEKMKVDRGGYGTEIIQMDFPSNSHKSKEKTKKQEKKVEKVTSGKVVKQKKSLGKKFAETFLGDNIESVSSYIIYDIIIPAAKNMISDTVSNGIEMLLFGQTRGSRTRRDRGKSYVSYSNYYKDRDRYRDRQISQRNRARHNFDDIILESRGEAEEVLSHLVDLTEDYGMASVADLYDLVGVTSNFTDNKYGWDNLSSGRVVPVRGGYLLELPRPIVLD
jgi:hypothetical protein